MNLYFTCNPINNLCSIIEILFFQRSNKAEIEDEIRQFSFFRVLRFYVNNLFLSFTHKLCIKDKKRNSNIHVSNHKTLISLITGIRILKYIIT